MQNIKYRIVYLLAALSTCFLVLFFIGYKQIIDSRATIDQTCVDEPIELPFNSTVTSASSPNSYNKIDSLNRKLFKKYQAINSGQITKQVVSENNQITSLLSFRKKYLISLMRSNPEEGVRLLTPAFTRQYNTLTNLHCYEKNVTLKGTIETLTSENIINSKKPNDIYYFLEGNNKFILDIAYINDRVIKSGPAEISGIRLGNDILVNLRSKNSYIRALDKTLDSMGEQKFAVLLANFSNTSQPALSTSTVNNIFFNKTNAFYQEVSYQQTFFSGSVIGWYTMNIPQTCDIQSTLQNAVNQAQNVDFTQFDRLVIISPMGPGCAFAGIASVGPTIVFTPQGRRSMSVAWIVSDYVQDNDFGRGVIEHELGHNFGLQHAGFLNCPTLDTSAQDCTYDDYGDLYNVMGNVSAHGHFSAIQKHYLGWLTDFQFPILSTSGNYQITPLEIAGTTSKGFYEKNAENGFLSAEYRQPLGYDASFQNFLPGTDVYNGSLIHLGTGNSSKLIDTTPPGNAFFPSLQTGNIFTDYWSGTTIKINSIGPNAINLSVKVGKTDFDPPIINIIEPVNDQSYSGTVNFSGSAIDISGIKNIDLVLYSYFHYYPLGTFTTENFSTSFDTTHLPNGYNDVLVYAFDRSGEPYNSPNNEAADGVSFIVNNTEDVIAPTLSITSPVNNATLTSPIVDVLVNTGDNVGIHRVEFYRDQETVPYIVSVATPFDTGTEAKNYPFSLGQHTISAIAYDFVGNQSEIQKTTFTVVNPPTPTPSPTLTLTPTPTPTMGLLNGGFEEVENNLRPKFWSFKNLVKKDSTITNSKHSGSRSFVFTPVGVNKPSKSLTQVINNINLPAGTTFTFGGWNKLVGNINKGDLKVKITALNTQTGMKKSYYLPFGLTAHNWQTKKTSFSPAFVVTSLTVNINYSGKNATEYFDDLYLQTPSITDEFIPPDQQN